jgi:pyridoxamine 5'-phosphate oxidase
MEDLGALRREYSEKGLRREDLDDNPIAQFQKWFQEAGSHDLLEPNAMTLATSDSSGRVTARTVLLKAFDPKGFVFYTNYTSRKAEAMTSNPQVALLFNWLPLERQVAITGRAEKISTAESFRYFATRPFNSKLGAWVSQQSSVISSRSLLEAQLEKLKEKFANGEVPLPDFWGGFRVVPDSIEFWQGNRSRLHDRFLYSSDSDGWKIERLSP